MHLHRPLLGHFPQIIPEGHQSNCRSMIARFTKLASLYPWRFIVDFSQSIDSQWEMQDARARANQLHLVSWFCWSLHVHICSSGLVFGTHVQWRIVDTLRRCSMGSRPRLSKASEASGRTELLMATSWGGRPLVHWDSLGSLSSTWWGLQGAGIWQPGCICSRKSASFHWRRFESRCRLSYRRYWQVLAWAIY